MKKGYLETAVGIFMVIGIVCIAYLAIRFGHLGWMDKGDYTVNALFTSVTGLKEGASVEIAGVPVGHVASIRLDLKSKMADVAISLKKDIKLSDDVIASVKTSGLIGDKFIKLTPGGSGTPLAPGSTIMDTESALDIEDLIAKYVFGKV
jgi:phospholipid/cholesterol/gamma-HCH transport system substrate-binding protein